MIQQRLEEEKQQYFEAKKKYKRFRLLMWSGGVIVLLLLCLYKVVKEPKFMPIILLALLMVCFFVFTSVIVKGYLQFRLEYKAWREMVRLNDCTRTGLHKKLWEKYKLTNLEGFLDGQTTIEHIFDHGDSLSGDVLRNDREMGFDLGEDSKDLYLWADTGKELLEETYIPLSEIEDIVALKNIMREYFEQHS
ncbi:MAG: hypothetical protein IJ333_10560 [Clostridia bacterium]|nr:hypothetical protein [Clostridia bacterium]